MKSGFSTEMGHAILVNVPTMNERTEEARLVSNANVPRTLWVSFAALSEAISRRVEQAAQPSSRTTRRGHVGSHHLLC